MIRYLAAVSGIALLDSLPGGRRAYHRLGELTQANHRGYELPLLRAGIKTVKQSLAQTGQGDRVLDLGTGWYFKDALLYALTGRFKVTAFDIRDLARMRYVQNYLSLLEEHAEEISIAWQLPLEVLTERLSDWAQHDTLEALLAAAGIERVISVPGCLPIEDEALSFASSYCVLPHVPPALLTEELNQLHRCLRPGGHMLHLIGYEDHFSFYDQGMSPFTHYRFEDRTYRLLFESSLKYQNRLLWPDFRERFTSAGFSVVNETGIVAEDRIEEMESLRPDLPDRFRAYPSEELAKTHSWVLLRKE